MTYSSVAIFGVSSLILLIVGFVVLMSSLMALGAASNAYRKRKLLEKFKDQDRDPKYIEQRIEKENMSCPLDQGEINNRNKYKYAIVRNIKFNDLVDVYFMDFPREQDQGYITFKVVTKEGDFDLPRKPYEYQTDPNLAKILESKGFVLTGDFNRPKAIEYLRDYDAKARVLEPDLAKIPEDNIVDLYEKSHPMGERKQDEL